MQVRLHAANAAHTAFLADASYDMVFWSPDLHHRPTGSRDGRVFPRAQTRYGVAFRRVDAALHPSYRSACCSVTRWTCRRPPEEYYAIIRGRFRSAGCANLPRQYLWWSRPDIGFFEWIGLPVPRQREETLVNAVAIKPGREIDWGLVGGDADDASESPAVQFAAVP